MSHPLVPTLIEMLQEATKVDFAQTPTVKFMASLRDKLVFTGFSQEDAETIVATMEIDVTMDAFDDEELETISVLYCELLNKVHGALVDNGFKHPLAAMLNMAKKFSLTLE